MRTADFVIKQNDTSPDIKAILKDAEENAIDLWGATVKFHLSDYPGEKVIINSIATIEEAENGEVKYNWQSGDTETAGRYKAEFQVDFTNGRIETFPNQGFLEIEIFKELA